MFSLRNQVALVTGASKGIGRVIATMLAQFGADVFVHCNKSINEAEDTANEIKKLGRNACVISANLCSHDDIKQMFSEISKKTKTIDILVNNAGIGKMNYLRFMSEEEWDQVLDTNLKGAFLCSKYTVKFMMQAKRGSIVNVASAAAITPGVRQVNYVASKAGLIAMTRAMAKELGSLGIRVNAVAPGPIRTGMNEMSKEEEERITKLIPLQRIGEPDDVAKAVVYLCSPMANYITGQVIQVDGGMAP